MVHRGALLIPEATDEMLRFRKPANLRYLETGYIKIKDPKARCITISGSGEMAIFRLRRFQGGA